jgi:two-component system, chemotaxis family, chemotaxis protein CheY
MKKLLVIDDADVMRNMLISIVEDNGIECEIFEADNGEDGLELFKKHSPDLITLDITMPKMEGTDVLQKIMEINSNIPVIMISALGQRTIVLKCLKMGAKGYIIKPFKEGDVLEKIKKYI